MVQLFFIGCSGVGEGFIVFISSEFLIRSLELKVENLVYCLPVLCSRGTVVTVITRLRPILSQLGVLDHAGPIRLISIGDRIFLCLMATLQWSGMDEVNF